MMPIIVMPTAVIVIVHHAAGEGERRGQNKSGNQNNNDASNETHSERILVHVGRNVSAQICREWQLRVQELHREYPSLPRFTLVVATTAPAD